MNFILGRLIGRSVRSTTASVIQIPTTTTTTPPPPIIPNRRQMRGLVIVRKVCE